MRHIKRQIRFSFLLVLSITLTSFGLFTPTTTALTTSISRFMPCATKSKAQPKNTYKTETISHRTVTVDDPTMDKGSTITTLQGHDGKRLITYTASYKKGVLTGCKHTGTKVTTLPVNTNIQVGTRVIAPAPAPVAQKSVAPAPAPVTTPAPTNCTNGTYVNSAGNTICIPEQVPASNGAPAGATARCSDGSYSFSQSRSGTCSHHGGVAVWL